MERGNDSNLDIPEPEQVVAFFVPTAVAGYVTEIIEIALRNIPGITVSAGTLTELPKHIGVPLSYLRNQEATALPDLEMTPKEPTKPSPPPQIPPKAPKTRVIPRSKFFKWKKMKKVKKAKKASSPETDTHCCAHGMAEKLAEKYGAPVAKPDGTASAPRLMIQYPDLPYMVPVLQNFRDVGVPRDVVDFCYNAVFTVDSNEHLPFLNAE